MNTEVSVANGKYTVVLEDTGGMHVLRYGKPWRNDFVGDNFTISLAYELDEARKEAAEYLRELQQYQSLSESRGGF